MTRKPRPRTVTRAVAYVPLALAERLDPGVLDRIPSPQTRSTLRNKGEIPIAWVGPQLLRYCADLEARLAPGMHAVSAPADPFGQEEDPVLEEKKRDALERVYRIFRLTHGHGLDWEMLLTVLTQIETHLTIPQTQVPPRKRAPRAR